MATHRINRKFEATTDPTEIASRYTELRELYASAMNGDFNSLLAIWKGDYQACLGSLPYNNRSVRAQSCMHTAVEAVALANKRNDLDAIEAAFLSGDMKAYLETVTEATRAAEIDGRNIWMSFNPGDLEAVWCNAMTLCYPETRRDYVVERARETALALINSARRDVDRWASDRGLLCQLEYKALYLHTHRAA